MADSDLTIILFALGLAVPVGLDAMKAKGRVARIGLWSLSGLLIAFAVFLVPLKKVLPAFVAWIGTAVSNPTAWLFLFFVAFICARPLWSKPTLRRLASADPAVEGGLPTVDEVTAADLTATKGLVAAAAAEAKADEAKSALADIQEQLRAIDQELARVAIIAGSGPRRDRLVRLLQRFRTIQQEGESAWLRVQNAAQNPAVTRALLGHRFDRAWLDAFSAWQQQVVQLDLEYQNAFGEELEPFVVGNFNRERPVDGEPTGDAEKQIDYRRFHHEHAARAARAKLVVDRFDREITALEGQLARGLGLRGW